MWRTSQRTDDTDTEQHSFEWADLDGQVEEQN